MPVYERGYTHWEPSGRTAFPAWWVIAKRGIAQPFKSRWMIVLLLGTWMPAIIKAVIIYFKLKAGNIVDSFSGGWSSIDPQGFLVFLEQQRWSVFVVLAIAGAGLVAADRRDNGLSLYFSRPLGLKSYLAGKGLIIMFYYFVVTLFPVYALCLFSFLIAPEAGGMELLLTTPLRATVYCLLSGASLSLILLAFSSMGTRSIFVMVWWTIVVMGTEAFGNLARGFQNSGLQAVNFLGNYHNAGSWIFSAGDRLGVPGWSSLIVVLTTTGFALFVLYKRIRPVEVVS
jgi:ABC-type transport system involved in multi-copper enzyme maturation permease subunit